MTETLGTVTVSGVFDLIHHDSVTRLARTQATREYGANITLIEKPRTGDARAFMVRQNNVSNTD